MELLLIRHAQTTSNVALALDTALPGADLTPLGETQVAALADALAAEAIDAVYASPATRARRTAEPLAQARGLELALRPELKEIAAGDWEMSTDPPHWIGYRDLVSHWFDGELDHALPGGETGHEALARFDGVVEEIAALGLERVAIVSHGGILRTWCARRGVNVTPDLARGRPISNTGIVRVTGSPGAWSVTEWDTTPL